MLANTAKAEGSSAGLADWIAGIAKRVDPADLRQGNSVIQILTTALEKEKAADKREPVMGLGSSR